MTTLAYKERRYDLYFRLRDWEENLQATLAEFELPASRAELEELFLPEEVRRHMLALAQTGRFKTYSLENVTSVVTTRPKEQIILEYNLERPQIAPNLSGVSFPSNTLSLTQEAVHSHPLWGAILRWEDQVNERHTLHFNIMYFVRELGRGRSTPYTVWWWLMPERLTAWGLPKPTRGPAKDLLDREVARAAGDMPPGDVRESILAGGPQAAREYMKYATIVGLRGELAGQAKLGPLHSWDWTRGVF